MSTKFWVLFWIACFFLYGPMFTQLHPIIFYPGFAVACALTGWLLPHIEIPNAVFWILFSFLLICALRPRSIGLGCFWLLIFARWSTYIHINPKVLTVMFWLGFAVIPCLADWIFKKKFSFVCFACWIAILVLLRHKITYLMSWYWVLAWGLLFGTLTQMLPQEMPIGWQCFWVPFIFLTGLGIRPDTSIGRFFLWFAVIWISRFPAYYLYLIYFRQETYGLFPFNLFSHKWRQSHLQWYPLSLRPCDLATANSVLCKLCDRLTNQSKLIMGSSKYLTRLEEWHDYGTLKDLEYSVSNKTQSCHLCHLFWFSISKTTRDKLATGPSTSIPDDNWGSEESTESAQPQDLALRVRVWEERPLSLYTYAELLTGNKPLSARVLIRRGEPFQKPSAACEWTPTGSSEHFQQAKTWLSNCRKLHTFCNVAGGTERELPTRLLYVEPIDPTAPTRGPIVRLELTEGKDVGIEYLALSHCWGGDIPFKLVEGNIETYQKGIPVLELCENMQDAFSITRNLGFYYIWIDSLCIIQDCNEDWAKEAVRMGAVYSNAVCTIASTGSASSTGGCFHGRSTLSLKPCKIGVSSLDSLLPEWIYACRDDVFDFQRNVDRSPLSIRAWVQQERLLSRRILHFGAEMMYWECCRRSASELAPNGYVYKRYPNDFYDNYFPDLTYNIETRTDLEDEERAGRGPSWAAVQAMQLRPPPVELDPDDVGPHTQQSSQTVWQRKRGFWKEVRKSSTEGWKDGSLATDLSGFRGAFERLRRGDVPEDQVGVSSFSYIWYEIVESYTRCGLSKDTDKLIALHSLVKEIQAGTGYTYLTGLWREHLLTDLLWFAVEGPGLRLEGTPTWSWASIKGTVALDLFPENSQLKIDVQESLAKVIVPLDDTRAPEGQFVPIKLVDCLYLHGPLHSISHISRDGTDWFLDIDKSRRQSIKYFPDVQEPDIQNPDKTELFCLSFFVLKRETNGRWPYSSEEAVQGLVVDGQDGPPESYKRVGFFTTSRMKSSRSLRKRLKQAPIRFLKLE